MVRLCPWKKKTKSQSDDPWQKNFLAYAWTLYSPRSWCPTLFHFALILTWVLIPFIIYYTCLFLIGLIPPILSFRSCPYLLSPVPSSFLSKIWSLLGGFNLFQQHYNPGSVAFMYFWFFCLYIAFVHFVAWNWTIHSSSQVGTKLGGAGMRCALMPCSCHIQMMSKEKAVYLGITMLESKHSCQNF